jgi:prepilin-type N-terminal cleavage/methylation domain-containing protein
MGKTGGFMKAKRRSGFTLIEVLIVVVIMAILAATIIPQFSSSTEDAKASSLKFNLHTMRAQIELYKLHHGGDVPAITGTTLPQLTASTDMSGQIGTTGPNYPYGPYIQGQLPPNSFDGKNTVTATANFPPTAATAAGGWFYHVATGRIAANHADHLND